ncbi:MAG: hypothetical protein RLY93_10720 [Sumerlaeia bacterium]
MPQQQSQKTTDHTTIRKWAESRKGQPAAVRRTGRDEDPGLLRIRFSDERSDDLEAVTWDEWFDKFEESKLAFVYQDETTEGGASRFNKLVSR